MIELPVLRILALKGRCTPETAAECLGFDAAFVRQQCDALVGAGCAKSTPVGVRVTPEGRVRLTELLEAERAEVDAAGMSRVYERFCVLNGSLKEAITAWQMKNESTPNDHGDADYDAKVIRRLADIHEQVRPVVDDAASLAPRVAHYAVRLQAAQDKIATGDNKFVARPIIDSYHTVWFELHEDLIGLCGLTRAAEAAAGRAQ